VRDACLTHHPETRVCFFAVPIVVLLTFGMINDQFWERRFDTVPLSRTVMTLEILEDEQRVAKG